MSDLVNLHAESGRDIIGDDTTPTLSLSNSSTGADLDLNTIQSSSATEGVAVQQSVVGNLSIGVLKIVGNSVASGAAIEFSNKAFVSITSIILTSVANCDYVVRVQVGNVTRWIPLFKDAALDGEAAF